MFSIFLNCLICVVTLSMVTVKHDYTRILFKCLSEILLENFYNTKISKSENHVKRPLFCTILINIFKRKQL